MRALSRKYANRKSTLRNLATSLILYERITTTTAKAKELRSIIERLLTVAARNDLVARRRLLAYLFDEKAVKKMFEVLAPRFKNIKSGFVKTYHLGARLGDGAEMMMIELIEGEKPKIEKVEDNDDEKGHRVQRTRKNSAFAKATADKQAKKSK